MPRLVSGNRPLSSNVKSVSQTALQVLRLANANQAVKKAVLKGKRKDSVRVEVADANQEEVEVEEKEAEEVPTCSFDLKAAIERMFVVDVVVDDCLYGQWLVRSSLD